MKCNLCGYEFECDPVACLNCGYSMVDIWLDFDEGETEEHPAGLKKKEKDRQKVAIGSNPTAAALVAGQAH